MAGDFSPASFFSMACDRKSPGIGLAPPYRATPVVLSLFHGAITNPGRIDPLKWVDGRCTRSPAEPAYVNVGGKPLVILTCELGSDAKEMVPQAVIFDSQQ